MSVSITYLDPRCISLRDRYSKALQLITTRNTERVIKVNQQLFLAELSITLSHLNRRPAAVVEFPKPVPGQLNGGISISIDCQATPTQDPSKPNKSKINWMKENIREKRAAILARLSTSEGTTINELVQMTGWPERTIGCVIRSFKRRGWRVERGPNATESWRILLATEEANIRATDAHSAEEQQHSHASTDAAQLLASHGGDSEPARHKAASESKRTRKKVTPKEPAVRQRTTRTKSRKQPARGHKQAGVMDLLKRSSGATLTDLIQFTHWKPHTARAFLSKLRKAGQNLESTKCEGGRTYRIID